MEKVIRFGSVEDLDPLKQLVKEGKVFDVQDWLQAGKPYHLPDESKYWPLLELAAARGVYAMVQILLTVPWSQASLDRALHRSVRNRHPEAGLLILKAGADPNSALLYDVAKCYSKNLMKAFFDAGVDITSDHQLAEAITAGVKPLSGLYREYRSKILGFPEELATALRCFVKEGNAKWVSLCLWMGADPRLPVSDFGKDFDDEYKRTALEDACSHPKIEILKLIKLDSARDNLEHLLACIYRPNKECVEYLLAQVANINNKPNGGSIVMDRIFHHLSFIGHPYFGNSASDYSIRDVEDYAELGARLVPTDSYAYRIVRDAICAAGKYRWEDFLGVIKSCCTTEVFWRIINVPRIRRDLGITPKRLMEYFDLEVPIVKKQKKARKGPKAPAKPSRPETVQEDLPAPKKIEGTNPPPQEKIVDPVETDEEKDTVSSKALPPPRNRSLQASSVVREDFSRTRNELYDLVWKEATWKIAPRYGLSDRGLGKICERHDIPKPPRGYWAKLKNGKKVKRIPLPNPKDNPQIKVSSPIHPQAIKDDKIAENLEHKLTEKVSAIIVPQRISNPHPLIQQTKQELLLEREREHGWKRHHGKSQKLDITVFDNQMPRALRIMDTLLKALEERGFTVEIQEGKFGSSGTTAEIFGEKIQFCLIGGKEGQLGLQLPWCAHGFRENWRDGKKQRVEHLLEDFIATMLQVAARKHEESIEREKRAKEREEIERIEAEKSAEEERRKEEERQRIQKQIDAYEAEQRRVAKLRDAARDWDEADTIRRYIEAVIIKARTESGDGSIPEDLETWDKWAHDQADRLDPMKESPSSILDYPKPQLPD